MGRPRTWESGKGLLPRMQARPWANGKTVTYLRALGLVVRKKPNGRPLVNRSHYDAVMGCAAAIAGAKSDSQPVWGVH